MSTASNAVKTAAFTLFVPLVVAGVIPQMMARRDRAVASHGSIAIIAGGLLIALGRGGLQAGVSGLPGYPRVP